MPCGSVAAGPGGCGDSSSAIEGGRRKREMEREKTEKTERERER
jgi:hypothetical protein